MAEIEEKVGIGESETKNVSVTDIPQKKSTLFQPGWKGGPGRPKGSVSPATRLRNEMAAHGEKIFNELMRQIDSGKAKPRDLIGALQFIVGPLRGEMGAVKVEGLSEAVTYTQKLEALERAVANGEISPDASKLIVDQLKAAEQARLMNTINDRIAQLEGVVINGQAKRVTV